jgi:hypothetical protein
VIVLAREELEPSAFGLVLKAKDFSLGWTAWSRVVRAVEILHTRLVLYRV